MKVVVTGGAGFIGSTLVDALLADGHTVAVIDDLSRGRREQVPDAADLHLLDVTSDDIGPLLDSVQPEVVFHLAAQIDVRRSVSEPILDTSVNVLGTVNVLQSCVSAGVRRVVFASSGGAIYGDTEVMPTPEEHPPAPASHYGAAKLCGEVYGGVYARLYGLEFTSLRYANVYGPRQDPHGEAGVVAIFAERLLRGEAPVINGDGLQTRDYVHVDDVVRANLAAMHGPVGAYNVGTGRQTDVVAVHRILAAAAGSDDPARHGPPKAGEQRWSCLSIERARTELGWRPTVDLDSGLAGTLRWFAEQRGAATPS
jgi:UDP-glucose 4-epimerase